MTRTKHKKRRVVLLFLVSILLIGMLFWYINNFTFTVTKTTITSPKVSAPITLVQLSDLHGASYGKDNARLIQSVSKQNPDLICITGDMYTNGNQESMEVAINTMEQLTSIAPVYFVPGEHDRSEQYLQTLEEAGITVLSYSQTSLSVGQDTISLYGIDNAYYSDTFNLFYEFDRPNQQNFSILLAHIPNFDAFNWFGPDLTLCGDTHGGLVQLPLIGPLYFDGVWFPELRNGDQYVTDKGLFPTYTGHVYVSGGLGNYPYPLRLFNQPEISVLTIIPEETK